MVPLSFSWCWCELYLSWPMFSYACWFLCLYLSISSMCRCSSAEIVDELWSAKTEGRRTSLLQIERWNSGRFSILNLSFVIRSLRHSIVCLLLDPCWASRDRLCPQRGFTSSTNWRLHWGTSGLPCLVYDCFSLLDEPYGLDSFIALASWFAELVLVFLSNSLFFNFYWRTRLAQVLTRQSRHLALV